MAATRTTTSERPSLILTGIAGISRSSRQVCPGWSCELCKGSESEHLKADQHDEALSAVAKRRRTDFEKPGREQHDKAGNDDQRAPPEFGKTVNAGADQKGEQQQAIAGDQHRRRIRSRRLRA